MMRKNKGFTIVAAVFVLIILGLLSSFIIGLSATTGSTTTAAIASANAYFASVSGIEWGINKTLEVAPSEVVECPPTTTLNLTQGSLNGFRVQVSCTQEPFTENPLKLKIHTLASKSEYSTIGSKDYTSREIKITIISGI